MWNSLSGTVCVVFSWLMRSVWGPDPGWWSGAGLLADLHWGSVPPSWGLFSQRAGINRNKLQVRDEKNKTDLRDKSHPVSSYLVDGEGQFGSCALTDVDSAALCWVTLHDGEDLQVTWGRGQVKVGQPGLFQVVEVSLSQSVPEYEDKWSNLIPVYPNNNVNIHLISVDHYLRPLSWVVFSCS